MSCTLNEAPCLEPLLKLKLTPDLIRIFVPALEMLDKQTSFTASKVSTATLQRCYKRVIMEYCSYIWLMLVSPYCPGLTDFNSDYSALGIMSYVLLFIPFFHRCNFASLSLLARYFPVKRAKLYSLVSLVQNSTEKTRHAGLNLSIHPHSNAIPCSNLTRNVIDSKKMLPNHCILNL